MPLNIRFFRKKNLRAHKNKFGTSLPPQKKSKIPPSNEELYGHGGFPAERMQLFKAPIKLAQPFRPQNCRQTNGHEDFCTHFWPSGTKTSIRGWNLFSLKRALRQPSPSIILLVFRGSWSSRPDAQGSKSFSPITRPQENSLFHMLKSRELFSALLLTRSGRQSLQPTPTPPNLFLFRRMLPSPLFPPTEHANGR